MSNATAPKPKTLNWREKQTVKYAVDTWRRDEQIKHAIKTVAGRLGPSFEKRPEPIAIVGYGPSLQDTWEQIKGFQYVVSCSGAHRFLIDRGIIPRWHVEVDPRSHKIALLGDPHPDVEYLVASTCHPDYFKHLDGFQVKLWHVFDQTAEGQRLLPPGEWAVTGGCDVGLRSLTLAAFMGFRDLHVFGLDGSARDGERHAGAHPNGKQKYAEVWYPDEAGQCYYTTAAMLEAARQTTHELKQMPAVRFTFYGQGLTQAMVKDFTPDMTEPTKPLANIIGFSRPELISSDYVAQNRQLHLDNLAYGVGGGRHAKVVLKLVDQFKTHSVLDYGCGKGYLAKALDFPIWEYDPAIPEKADSPRAADIVVCTDVLEHVEPDLLNHVLADLHRVTRKVGYFVVHTTAARKTLPDGRNTHLIQEGEAWWLERLQKFFVAKALPGSGGGEVRFVVVPK